MPHLDQIVINQLKLEAIIGVYPEERLAAQPIVLDLELSVDTSKAAKNDDLADAMDYHALIKKLQYWISQQSFQLIEALAHYLVDNMLAEFAIQVVRLRLSKFPAGLPVASVGVVVTRHKKM